MQFRNDGGFGVSRQGLGLQTLYYFPGVQLGVLQVWQREAQDGGDARQLLQLLPRHVHPCAATAQGSVRSPMAIAHTNSLPKQLLRRQVHPCNNTPQGLVLKI